MLADNVASDTLRQFRFIILSEPVRKKIILNDYTVEECGFFYERKSFKVRSLWQIRTADDCRILLSRLKKRYYLLIKSEPPQRKVN